MPTPLPGPYLPDVSQTINAARMGDADRLAKHQRGVLQQAGQQAAQGSLGEARKSLLAEGMFKEADHIGQMISQVDAGKLAKVKKTYDVLGNLARTADTPEKWQQMIQAATQGGMDVAKYGDFGMRDLVLAQSGKIGDHLDYEMKRRGLDLKERALDQKAAGGGVKPPSGYRWSPDGQSQEAIPGGPATKMPAEMAGRMAALQTAKESFGRVREFYQGQGTMDRVNQLANRGKAGQVERNVSLAIEAALRAMTGAAAPESEVKNYLNLFGPSALDTPETIKDKLDRLESFMGNVEANIAQGRSTGTEAAPPAQQQQEAPSPFPEYPAAQQAPDGNWYVEQNGQYFRIDQ